MQLSYSKGLLKEDIEIVGVGKIRPKGFDAAQAVGDLKRFRKMDRFTQFLVAAARLALQDAKLELPKNTGAVIATRYGPFNSIEKFLKESMQYGSHLASAFNFPNTVMNMACGMLSISFGLKGPTLTLAGGLEQAMEQAVEFIKHGRAVVVLAGCVEEKNRYFPVKEEGATVCVLKGVKKNAAE